MHGHDRVRGVELDELRDFYEQYIAAFNARDTDAFAGFFHLPVTIVPLASDDDQRGGTRRWS